MSKLRKTHFEDRKKQGERKKEVPIIVIVRIILKSREEGREKFLPIPNETPK